MCIFRNLIAMRQTAIQKYVNLHFSVNNRNSCFHTLLPTLGIMVSKFLPDRWNVVVHYFDLYFFKFKKLRMFLYV